MTTAGTVPVASNAREIRNATNEPLPAWLFPALLITAIIAYWLPRLSRGFWIDEATTYWIDQRGWSEAWVRLTSQVGQSILYQYFVLPFMSGGGAKEMLLRVPSIIGMLAAVWLLYKLTERIAGRGSGWLAAIPFVCAGAVIETATNARPYALGLAVILASFWSLLEWVQSRERKWLTIYCVSSALVVYFHYLFAVVFLVQAAYLTAARYVGKKLSWRAILTAGCGIAFAAVPLGWRVVTLAHQARTWTSAVKPTLATFLALFPWQAIIAVVMGLVLFFALYREWFTRLKPLADEHLVLVLSWMLLGPTLMFLIQSTTGLAVFATRYLMYALPPCFILLAWLVGHVGNQRGRFALMVAIAMSTALYVSDIGSNTPEWRTPLRIAQEAAGADTPILLRSAHADAVGFDWRTEPNPEHHYFAQLAPYPLRNEIIPIPYFIDSVAARLLEQETERRMGAHRRFCLVADKGSDIMDILPAWFRQHGYGVAERDVAGIEVVTFQR